MANQLNEVGLAACEVVNVFEGFGAVVYGEVFVGVGDELVGGCVLEEADGDFADAAEEGIPIVLGHFL